MARLFGQRTGYWMSVLCLCCKSPQMGLLEGCLLIVEIGIVPGTMDYGYCFQPIVGSPGSPPEAGLRRPVPGVL